ncbi:MAG: Crp/Fnr family transcriptional regulator [Bacillota bacterium]|nr:Crp/Fnr family transcriptional regulator [Bacillota bacterium]
MLQGSQPLEILGTVPLFSGLDQAGLAKLSGIARRRRYERGSPIFFEGDPGGSLLIIAAGAVKIHKVSEDGREKTLAILEAGDFFGEMSIFDGAPRSAAAQALSNCEVLIIDRDPFLGLMKSTPGLATDIALTLAERLRRTNEDLERLAFRDARGRIIEALLQLARAHGERAAQGVRLKVRLTHQELANYAGVTRETVTRVLAELHDSRLVAVEDDRRLVIQNEDALRGLVT